MKKTIFLLFFFILFTIPALADFRVDQVSADVVVRENGKAKVTERIQLTFDSATDKVTVPLPEGSLSRISAENFHYSVEKTDEGVNVIFSARNGFAGSQTFSVSYQLSAPSMGSGETFRYSVGILSSRWAKDVGACSFQVTLPASSVPLEEGFQLEPQVVSGYYGEMKAEDTALTVSGTMLSGSVRELMAYDTIAIQVELPQGYFHIRSASIPGVSITFWTLGMLLLLGLCVLYWYFKLRTPRQSVSSRPMPPGGLLTCQLPQALDGYTCDFAALILEWANLGYLSLRMTSKGQLALIRGIQMGSERSRAEQKLYQRLFAGKIQIAANQGRFAAAGSWFRSVSRKSLGRVCFDKTGGNVVLVQMPCRVLMALGTGIMSYRLLPDAGGFVILAVLFAAAGFFFSIYYHKYLGQWMALRRFSGWTILMLLGGVVLLILALLGGAFLEMGVGLTACTFSALATAAGPRRSKRGSDILMETKGCRRYDRRVDWRRLQLLVGRDNRCFQKQLPRAVALGTDRVLAKRFDRLPVPQPEWISGIRLKEFSAKELQKQLRPVVKAIRAAFSQ